MSITIHAVVPEALQDLSERLHDDDVRELLAYGWESPLEALTYSIDNCRETYMVSWHGKVQGIFGVADYPHDTRFGTPWFLSTGPHGAIRRQFLSLSRKYIEAWSPMYLGMFNLVDANYVRAQRWLMHLGFAPLKVHDINGNRFIEFGYHTTCALP